MHCMRAENASRAWINVGMSKLRRAAHRARAGIRGG
jgi:hypothetical protein